MKKELRSTHIKIYDPTGASLVAILPMAGHDDASRDHRNVVAQLRRAGYQV
jgi:hypothetical protein